MTRLRAIALAALAFACDAPAPADAGPVDAGGPFSSPEAPAPPAPPCPESWVDCAPPPLEDCAGPSEVRFADGCRAFDPCPAGDWPEPLPEASAHLFVREGASDGDGTQARPLGSIQEAIRRAAVGTAVVVGPGVYDEALDVFGGVTVVGVCAERAVLAASDLDAGSAVRLAELNTGIASVTVRPAASLIGVEVRSPGSTLRSVIVEGAWATGVTVQSGELSAEHLVVRDTADVDGGFGFGLNAEGGGEVTATDLWLERNRGAALIAGRGARIDAERAYLRANGAEATDAQCIAQDGASVEVRAAVIGDAQSGAGFAIGAGASLRLVDSWVGALSAHESGESGTFTARESARVELSRVRITETVGYAIGVVEGSTALIEDVAIGPIGRGRNGDATGLACGQGASTIVRRLSVEGAASVGVLAGGAGTLDAEDVRVRGTGDGAAGLGSLAIGLGDGMSGRLARVAIEDAERAGLLVSGSTTQLEIDDLLISDMRPAPDGTAGRAIEIQGGATIRRARIERSLENAILTIAGGRLDLEDAIVVDTRARACAESSCPQSPGGSALAAIGIAEVRARGFEVDGARLCGAQVAAGASLDLSDGEIRGAAVGACVQVEGYDLGRLTDGVVFVDNEVNVDTVDHALPEASPPLPSF